MRLAFFPFHDQFIAFDGDSLHVSIVSSEEKKRLEAIAASDRDQCETANQCDDRMSTLVLHVSNTCNMACAYCFANHGKYRSEDALMSVDTALAAVDRYLDRYGEMKEIKFFGGEPLCAWPVIEETVLHVEARYGGLESRRLPTFRIITNGTLLNDQMIAFIALHRIKVVFSIDGPRDLHDSLRYDKGGKGTLEKIDRQFWRLREMTSGQQPQGIDVTYTAEHIRTGYGIARLVEALSQKYAVPPEKINVSLVSADPDSPFYIEDEYACICESLRQYQEHPDMADQKVSVLLKRLRKGKQVGTAICGAGGSWAAVSSTGDVYPCLMFVDEPTLHMGNVHDEHLFQTERWNMIHDHLSGLRQSSARGCDLCPYNRLCSSCMGINSFHTGSFDVVSEEDCRITREKIEWCIRCIAQEQWQQRIEK